MWKSLGGIQQLRGPIWPNFAFLGPIINAKQTVLAEEGMKPFWNIVQRELHLIQNPESATMSAPYLVKKSQVKAWTPLNMN